MKKLRKELGLAIKAIKQDKLFFRQLICLTVLFYFLTWINVYISFRAFNVHVDFPVVCAMVPTIMFVAHVPVTLL
jgi:hypothetical protein